mgnify:CR=1 FL=1
MADFFKIPDTDLNLCPLGLGTSGAGLDWDGADADYLFDAYLDMGGNLIDTARIYSDWVAPETGRSERVIGDWIRRSGKRNHVLISTKGGHPVFHGPQDDLHLSRMSAADMRYDLELSLRALHTDVIDLYFYHRDDLSQSVEEEIEVMEAFRKEGKIRYYGCSNWTADRVKTADAYCKAKGYRGFVADQALLNLGLKYMKPMADDTLTYIEGDLYAYHEDNPGNLAMPYMGVASGFFHRYINKGVDAVREMNYFTPENVALAKRCKELMRKYEATVSQVVLGFFRVQEFACLPLYGPRNVEQLRDVMRYVEIPFTKEDYVL